MADRVDATEFIARWSVEGQDVVLQSLQDTERVITQISERSANALNKVADSSNGLDKTLSVTRTQIHGASRLLGILSFGLKGTAGEMAAAAQQALILTSSLRAMGLALKLVVPIAVIGILVTYGERIFELTGLIDEMADIQERETAAANAAAAAQVRMNEKLKERNALMAAEKALRAARGEDVTRENRTQRIERLNAAGLGNIAPILAELEERTLAATKERAEAIEIITQRRKEETQALEEQKKLSEDLARIDADFAQRRFDRSEREQAEERRRNLDMAVSRRNLARDVLVDAGVESRSAFEDDPIRKRFMQLQETLARVEGASSRFGGISTANRDVTRFGGAAVGSGVSGKQTIDRMAADIKTIKDKLIDAANSVLRTGGLNPGIGA